MAELTGLHKKAQKALDGALEASEQALVVQPGEKSALVATDRRILVCKWGVTTGSMFGSQVNSWELAHVTGIESRKGMTTTAIVVQTAGAQVVTDFGRMASGPASVWEAPNAIFADGGDPEGTVSKLRQMVADHHRGNAATSASAASVEDPAEQIRKFAALRDEGLISEEEFQAKKTSILGL